MKDHHVHAVGPGQDTEHAQDHNRAQELSIERLMDAPVEALWAAYHDHLGEWFCPPPWRAEPHIIDLRPGGRCSITMYGPEGEEVTNEGVFLEVIPNQLIISTDAFTHDWQPAQPFFVAGIELTAQGDQTHYRGWARHWSENARNKHEAMGFVEGWTKVAEQWEGVARRIAGLDDPDQPDQPDQYGGVDDQSAPDEHGAGHFGDEPAQDEAGPDTPRATAVRARESEPYATEPHDVETHDPFNDEAAWRISNMSANDTEGETETPDDSPDLSEGGRTF